MKKFKYKLSFIMILTTVLLFVITILAINLYQQKYIFERAEIELKSEAKYFYDYSLFLKPEENIDRFFNVNILFMDDFEDIYTEDLSYINKEEKFFNDLYKKDEMEVGSVSRLKSDFGDYYALLIKVSDKMIVDNFERVIPEEGEVVDEVVEEELNILLYIDISSYSNIIHNLNKIFSILLLVVVIIEGLVGMFLGTKLEDIQLKLKHFFENASHELKTPLMSIQGYAEGMKSGVIKDKEMATNVILKNSENMNKLIEELLNISKIDSGEYTLKREEINLRDLVEDIVESYAHILSERSISLELNLDDDCTFIGDGLQMYKAVKSVIDNAVKFVKSEIKISSYGEKSYIILDVYNDGKTINEKDLSHIFDRFYSGNDISTGIGLAMAKEIILLSKGDISAHNRENGVLFRIKIKKYSL